MTGCTQNSCNFMLAVLQIAGIHPKCVSPDRMRREAFPMCCCTFELVRGAENGIKKTESIKSMFSKCRARMSTISIYHKENLLQSTNCPSIPVRVEILAIRIASHQMLRQNHNETLENNQEETLLVDIGRFQFLFHLFDHFFGGLLANLDFLSLVCCFIFRIARWWFDTWQFFLGFSQFSSYRSVQIVDLPSVHQSKINQ